MDKNNKNLHAKPKMAYCYISTQEGASNLGPKVFYLPIPPLVGVEHLKNALRYSFQ